MKKLFGLLLAAVMAFSLAACGQGAEVKTEIVRNSRPVMPVEIQWPKELENYHYVETVSFDGQYAIMTADRAVPVKGEITETETVKLYAYDVHRQKMMHYVNVNLTGGFVVSGAKDGDNLYYIAEYPNRNRAVLYINNGLETKEIGDIPCDNVKMNPPYILKTGDRLMVVACSEYTDTSRWDFYLIYGENMEKIYSHEGTNLTYLTNIGYNADTQQVEFVQYSQPETGIWQIDRVTGGEKQLLLENKRDYLHFAVMDNLIFHYVEDKANTDERQVLAVTDYVNGGTTKIGLMSFGGFYNYNSSFGLIYEKDGLDMVQLKVENGAVVISPVATDFGENASFRFIGEGDSALMQKYDYNTQSFSLYVINK